MPALVEGNSLKTSGLSCLVRSAQKLLRIEGISAGATEEELLPVPLYP
jgi:hypothetical protein